MAYLIFMKKHINKYIVFFLFTGIIFCFYFWRFDLNEKDKSGWEAETNKIISIPTVKASDRVKEVKITKGATFGKIMEEAGVDEMIANNIYNTSHDLYDLSQIRLGRFIELFFDKETSKCKGLNYKINSEEKLCVKKDGGGEWKAEIKSIEYDIKIKIAKGEVKSSMYKAAIENDIDERAIIELANAFQWNIDFAMDARVGDTFKFIYEERYLDGKYIMPGRVLAGQYINARHIYRVYYFKESEENSGYFDADGNSVQKMFLRAPVAFKYISSGYTSGRRYVEAFNVSTGHRAIDYAADYGSPIRAVGDGTVIFAGWSSVGYGNLTKIRHNSTYSTNYAHQSKIAVKKGQHVKQGQIIGYVGSTGFSTGPHLHYEMVKNGVKINPLKEILPPGKPIKEENRERFFKEIKKYSAMLND